MTTKTDYFSQPSRLEALHRLEIMDSETEEFFDALTRFASSLFGVALATIHLIDDKRLQVKASSNGICAPDMPLGETLCEHTVAKGEPVFIPDLQDHRSFCHSEFVTGPSKFRFYAGMPLKTKDGFVIGTLCLFDTQAHAVEPFSNRMLDLYRLLSNIVVSKMELRGILLQPREVAGDMPRKPRLECIRLSDTTACH